MLQAFITTFSTGFIFAFLLFLVWGHLVEKGSIFGGMIAGAFIVGGCWILNHGAGYLVQGANSPWVDQAWAVGVGGIFFGIGSKASFTKSIPTIIATIIGGTLGGFILAQKGGVWF